MNKTNFLKTAGIVLLLLFTLYAPSLICEVNAESSGTLTVHVQQYKDGSKFCLYRIADIDGNGNYVAGTVYGETGIDLNQQRNNSDWMQTAEVLSSFVNSNSIKADFISESEGNIVIFRNLPEGLYLLEGESYSDGSLTIIPQSGLTVIKEGQDAAEVNMKEEVRHHTPDTGDSFHFYYYLCVLGLDALIVVSWLLVRKGNRE